MAIKTKNELVKPNPAALVPAGKSQVDYIITTLPEKAGAVKELNLPPLLKPAMIPVGQTVSGELISIVVNFTGRADLKETKVLRLKHSGGTEFMLPLSGTIKQALKSLGDISDAETFVKSNAGKTFYFTRCPDMVTKKYGGEKLMFSFDVFVSE